MSERSEIPSRSNDRPHLSECLLATAYELDWPDPEQYHCTCEDDSPEWTLS